MATPVTVVMGAMGVGKSRLIKRQLEGRSDVCHLVCRYAGEVGCQAEGHVEAFETLEHLCLCCCPREELEEQLRRLPRQQWSRLVVESSGLADPAFLRVFLVLNHLYRVDSVVCVVDAHSFAHHDAWAADGSTRSIEHEQVAVASLLLLTHPLDAATQISSYFSQRSVLVGPLDDVPQGALLCDTNWRFEVLLQQIPSYFNDPTPYRRHQQRYTWANLVNVQPMTPENIAHVLEWTQSVPFVRCKGMLYSDAGKRIALDGYRGRLITDDAGSWDPSAHIPANKLAFVGLAEYMEDSAQLKLSLEKTTGIVMHPTVMYSAPAPEVDTWTQRIIVLILLAAIFMVPRLGTEIRVVAGAAILLYFFLSRSRRESILSSLAATFLHWSST